MNQPQTTTSKMPMMVVEDAPVPTTIVNFSHPITATHQRQIADLLNIDITQLLIIDVRCQIDQTQPLVPQAAAIVDAAGLFSEDWQTRPLVVNPPALANASLTVVADIHGRMGYWPPILRVVADNEVGGFKVSEIVQLQRVRDDGRWMR